MTKEYDLLLFRELFIRNNFEKKFPRLKIAFLSLTEKSNIQIRAFSIYETFGRS